MAFYLETFCQECKKDTMHWNGKCQECFKKEEELRIGLWEALSLKDQIKDLRERIEKLEKGPMRY